MTGVAVEIVTRSPEETEALGERIGRAARPGDVLALWGELGAGKTVLARGIARGLGVARHAVTSPTFVIVHEHDDGRLPFFHIDMYRLAPADTPSTGWEEALSSGGVTAIEWPDRVADALPADRLDVRIDHVDGVPPGGSAESRRIRLEPTGSRSAELAKGAA